MGWQPVAFTLLEIVGGVSGAGLFIYDGSPAEGSLVLAMVPTATEDAFGNAAPAIFNVGVWSNTGALLQHFGIDSNGRTYWADDTGMTTIYGDGETGVLQVGQVVYMAPGDISTPETWHYVGAAGQPAFGTGWSNRGAPWANVAFRLLPSPANEVEIMGWAHVAATGDLDVFTLPAGYIPASMTSIIGWDVTGNAAFRFNVDTSGLVSAAVGTLPDTGFFMLYGRVSLDI